MAVKYYTDCSEIPIYNFHKIMETNNYAYLVWGWDEKSKTFQDNEKCAEIWDLIYNEYCKLIEDNTMLLYYDLYKEIVWLKTRNYIVLKLLEIMFQGTVLHNKDIRKAYIEALLKWGFKVDESKKITEEVEKIKSFIKFSKNKIELKEDELENLNTTPEEQISFESEVVSLEIALNKNFIDPKITSVKKWRALIDKLKEKNAQIKKAS